MKIVDHVTTSIPKSIYFKLDEVELILELLKMKLSYSTEREVPKIESLIHGFESLLPELHEQERHKAGY